MSTPPSEDQRKLVMQYGSFFGVGLATLMFLKMLSYDIPTACIAAISVLLGPLTVLFPLVGGPLLVLLVAPVMLVCMFLSVFCCNAFTIILGVMGFIFWYMTGFALFMWTMLSQL
jgi:hypothetical protein